MKLKLCFLTFFAISVLFFSSCDFLDWLLEDPDDPDKPLEGGGYGLVLRAFTTEKTSVTQYEGGQFIVNYDIRNPGTETFNGSLSAILTDNAGVEIATIGTRDSTSFSAGSGRISNVTCNVPIAVTPGLYQLRIVVRPAGGERRIITDSVNSAPTSISFQVLVNNNVVVAPMTKTQWSQFSPYNDLFPPLMKITMEFG